jgi:hypothetical protein
MVRTVFLDLRVNKVLKVLRVNRDPKEKLAPMV